MKRLLFALWALVLLIPALRTLGQPCVALTNNPVAWWRAEGDAQDAMGVYHGTLAGGVACAPGKVGQAFNFSGANYVDIPYSPTLFSLAQGTLEFWAIIPDLNVNESLLFSIARTGVDFPTPGNHGWAIGYRGFSGNRFLQISASNGSEPTMEVRTPVNSITDTNWHHIAVVANGTGPMQVYIDGVSQALNTPPYALSGNSAFFAAALGADNMKIGTILTSQLYSGGPSLIDEMAIYDRGLSAAEVQALYQAGSSGRCIPPVMLVTSPLPGGQVGTSYSNVLTAVHGAPPYTYSVASGSLPAGLSLSVAGVISGLPISAGSNGFTLRVTDNLGIASQRTFNLFIFSSVCVPVANGLVAWWRAEGDGFDSGPDHFRSGTRVNDTSFGPGREGQAFYFDGVDDYVEIPYDPWMFNLQQGTLEFWFKIADPSTSADLFGVSTPGIPVSSPLASYWTVYYGGTPYYRLGLHQVYHGQNYANDYTPIQSVTDTNWHHFAVVADTYPIKFYLDGLLQTLDFDPLLGAWPKFFDSSVQGQQNFTMTIGAVLLDVPFASGAKAIDELAIYNRGLSAAEIQAIYAAGLGKCAPPLILTTTPLPTGAPGTSYSNMLTAAYGSPPYTFSLVSGSLPSGLSLSTAGVISGTLNAVGANGFTVRVTDNIGSTSEKAFTLSVFSSNSTPAPDGLVAWFRAEGDAVDFAGDHSGTLVNGTTFAPGKVGQAFSFDGVDDYVQIPFDPALFNLQQGTLEFWFKLSDPSTNANLFALSTPDSYSQGSYWVVRYQGAPYYQVNLFEGYHGGFYAKDGTPFHSVTDTNWHHFAIVADTYPIKFYLDGLLQTLEFDPLLGAWPRFFGNSVQGQTNFTMSIGAELHDTVYAAGAKVMDEVAIYNRGLSAAEIQAIYTAGLGKNPAPIFTTPETLPDANILDPYALTFSTFLGTKPFAFTIVGGGLPDGLALAPTGVISGTPTNLGNYGFTVLLTDAASRTAVRTFSLKVVLRPPHFTQPPTEQDLQVGDILWLAAQTDLPATLQWYFNGSAVPGETNAWFIRTNFTAPLAGSYTLTASNGAGITISPSAGVHLLQSTASRDGPVPQPPTMTELKQFQMGFATQPERTYLLQRADELTSPMQWSTVLRFKASQLNTSFIDEQTALVHARYYRVIEEPAPQPSSFSMADTSHFVPLDSSGQPIRGGSLATNQNGQTGPFEMRLAGDQVAEGLGLKLKFATGAQLTQTNGQTQLQFTNAQFQFGPDSPLQFNETLLLSSSSNLSLTAGPLSVSQIEILAGKIPGSGLEVTIFNRFHLRLTRGTISGSKILGAQFQLESDASLNLPLPGLSGNYPQFSVQLDPSGTIQIPFSGTFALPDDTASPVTLTIPPTRPVVLELRADGHLGVTGHADAEFHDGPKFGVDFTFSDPQYRLRLSASHISLPPLFSVADLLPSPPTVPDSTDDATLNPIAQRLEWSETAAANFAALTVNDATPTNAPGPDAPPAIEPGGRAFIELWKSVALANGLGTAQSQIEAAASRAARTAASSDDALEVAQALSGLAELAKKAAAPGGNSSLADAADSAAAGLTRVLTKNPCGDLTPATLNLTLSNLFTGTALLQQLGSPRATELLDAAKQVLICFAQQYLQQLDVQLNIFTNPPGSRIAGMQRYEAAEHLAQLIQLRAYAQQLGIVDTLNAPMTEGHARLALRMWDELRNKMESAIGANDRRTYLYLMPELAEFVVLVQSGVLPQRAELATLPDAATLADLYNRAFQNGPVEIAAQDAYGTDLTQLRDDLKRFRQLLQGIPENVSSVPSVVSRNYNNLNQRLASVVPYVGANSVFGTKDLSAALEAGIVNEEIRLRFHLATDSVWLDSQLGAIAQKLASRVETDKDWSQAHVAARLLLEAAARAVQKATNVNTSASDAAAYRIARKAYLKEAQNLCTTLGTIAASLWDDAANRRNANLGLRLVDMLLPGGIEVDEAAGELSYNSRAHTVSGAISGKMQLPGAGLALNLNNASFKSGGAFDFNLDGSFDLPNQGTLVHFEVPEQHPLHLALDLDRHLTIEGGLKARLKNGMEFDAWASLNDPVYTFGAAVRGVRFSLATNLTLNLQVPDLNALAQLPGDAQPLMMDYFGALGGTLDPLRAVVASPAVAPVGQPPEFTDPTVSFNSDTLAAASLSFRLLASNSVSLGFSTVQNALGAITNIAVGVSRELDRSAISIVRLGENLTAPLTPPSDSDARRAARQSSLDRLWQQTSALTNDLFRVYSNLTVGLPGSVGGLLTRTNLIGVLGAASDALHAAVNDPANAADHDAALIIARIGIVWETVRQTSDLSELPDVCSWLSPFISSSRASTIARAGLNANGTLPANRSTFDLITYDQFIGFATEVAEQEQLLQALCAVDDHTRFVNAMSSFYVGRHDIIVRRIRDTETKPLDEPFTDDVVRQIQVYFNNLVPVLETEDFAQRVGVNLQSTVSVLDFDGTFKSPTIDAAQIQLLEHISSSAGKIADFIESAAGGTSQQRLTLTEYVMPELRRWARARKNGLAQVAVPARTVYPSTAHPFPQDVRSSFARVLEKAVRQRLDELAADAAHNLTLGTADALRRFGELVALAETIDLTLADSLKTELLGRLQNDIFPPFRIKLIGVAQANKAWWLAQRAAHNLLDAARNKAHSDTSLFFQVLTSEFNTNRNAAAGLLAVLREDVRSQTNLFDFKLPGGLNVADVHGEITFNTKTKFISGDFGGRLEFPNLHDSFIAIDRLHLDTDGRFDFTASADISLPGSFPGFDKPRFNGHLTADGQKAGGNNLDGTLKLTGAGTLTNATAANGESFSATLGYQQVIVTNSQGHEQITWQLAVSVSGHVNLVLDQDFVLFDAAAGGSVGSGGVGPVSFGGKAAMFRKDRNLPLPADHTKLTPDLFQLVVENVEVEIRTNHDIVDFVQVSITNGDLRLPELFHLSTNVCDNPGVQKKGPQVGVAPGHPIIVQFDLATTNPQRQPLRFSGGVQFYNLGFPIPLIPGMEAELCTATLFFNDFDLPVFTNISASLQLPLPNNTTNYLDLKDGAFSFDGLPTGFITIRSNLDLCDIDGLKLTLIGNDNPSNTFSCTYGTGLTVTNDGGVLPTFILSGGLRVTLPADVATGVDGDAVSGAVCGRVKLSFPTRNGPPDVNLELTDFLIKADSLHIGGADGLVITNAELRLNNISSFLNPTEQLPFTITVGAGVILPNGPLLALKDAKLKWFDPHRLPRFSFSELDYNGQQWELMQGLPIQLTKASLRLKNPDLELPDLLRPTNVTITISAAVNVPPDPDPSKVVIRGAVDNLVIEFETNGVPKKPSIDGFEMRIGNLKIPPINDIGGSVRVGGLQGDSLDSVYIVGRLSGSFSTYKLAFLGAFTWTGPVGMCLDVNLGPSGVVLSPTPFVLSGASGGISFINGNGDPCAFDSYFTTDPRTGNKVLKSVGTKLISAMSWSQFRDTVTRMEEFAQNFPKPPLTPPDFSRSAGSPSARPVSQKSGGGDNGNVPSDVASRGSQTIPSTNGPVTIDCPGDCPPATVNIVCQPHPDRTNYPNRIILKFSAIDRSTLATIGLGPDLFNGIGGTAAEVANQMAPTIALHVTNLVAGLTPPILPGVPTDLSNTLAQAQASVLNLLYTTTIQTITNVLGTNTTTAGFYDKFADLAWQGIPCQDITLAVSGRGSIVGIGAVAYVEGKRIGGSSGSDCYIGILNVLGFPLGQARGCVSITDANGDPNPSACGQVNVNFGPLDIGELHLSLECTGCVTRIISAVPALAHNISDSLVRDIIGRLTPAISNLNTLSGDQIIAQVMALPDTNRFPVLMGFLTELANQPPGALPVDLPRIFAETLSPVIKDINPRLTLCGETAPKLFGFPLLGASKVSIGAQVDKEGYIGAFSFPPSGYIPFMPPGDLATFSWDLRMRDPSFFLAGTLDGNLSSPSNALEFAREQIDYALEHTVFAVAYEFHPFGLRIADAGARLIMPDLLNHPAMPGSTWKKPEERNLPSRQEVLVRAAVAQVLGNAFGWHGDKSDFFDIYETNAPQYDVLKNQALDLRKDYFPHGGLIGAGQLALPLMLGENPTNWAGLISDLQTNANILKKLQSAQKLVGEHILQTTTNGEFAFYLPAPNPLILYADNGSNAVADADGKINNSNVHSLTAQQVLDSIKQFDPAKHLHLGNIYPYPYAFGSGFLHADFLGLPVGSVSISVNLDPDAHGGSFGYVIAKIPPNSWLVPLLGTMDITNNLMAPPPLPIDAVFIEISNRIDQAISCVTNDIANGGNGFACASNVLATVYDAIATNLPKAYLEVPLPTLSDFLPPVVPFVRFSDGMFYAYSPRFDTNSPDTTPVSRARRDGGLAASCRLAVYPDPTAPPGADPLLQVEHAELAVTLQDNGFPRYSGLLSNITFNPLLNPPLVNLSPEADGTFDSAGNPLVSAHVSVSPIQIPPSPALPFFTLEPLTPGATKIAADFTLGGGSAVSFPVASLAMDPVKFTIPLEPPLLLHGSGNATNRLVLTTGGSISAGVSFRDSPSSDGCSFDLMVGTLVLARISGLPQEAFEVTGNDLNNLTLSFAIADTNGPLTIKPFPDNATLRANLPSTLTSFTIPSTGDSVFFSLDSQGKFALSAVLANGVAGSGGFLGFQSNARVRIDNSGITIQGTAFNGSATVFLSATPGGDVTITGDLTLNPWSWFNGCVILSAADGGAFHATAGSGGFQVSQGLKLTICDSLLGSSISPFSLPGPLVASDGSFSVNLDNPAAQTLTIAGYPVKGFSTLHLSGIAPGYSGTYLRLDFAGDLNLSPVLHTSVSGFLDTRNGVLLQLSPSPQNLTLLGLDFQAVTASLSGTASQTRIWPKLKLSVSGTLPSAWNFLPSDLRSFSGSLEFNGKLDLKSLSGKINNALSFALANATNRFGYTPGSYVTTIQSGGPAGYWRLEDNNGTAADSRATAYSSGNPAHPGTFKNAASYQQAGAFETNNNKAVLFNGVNQYVKIDNETAFDFSQAVTIEFWFKTTASGSYGLVGKGGSWKLELLNGQVSFFTLGLVAPNGSDVSDLTSSGSFRDGNWHHAVGVYDGSAKFLYVDGKLNAWTPARGNLAQNNNQVVLAASSDDSGPYGYFPGTLDEVAVYGRPLSPADVVDHYLAGGHGGIHLDATLDNVAGVPSSLRNLSVHGVLAADQTAALQIDTVGNTLDFCGIQAQNFSASVVKTAGAGMITVRGDLCVNNLAGSHKLGSASGFLANDGSFNFALTSALSSPLNRFATFYVLNFAATGNWQTGVGSANFDGRFDLPHGAGSFTFGGTNANTVNGHFTLYSASDQTLTLGSKSFSVSGRMMLTESQLSASGNYRLGSPGSNAKSFGASLSLASGGGISVTLHGNTGWQGFDGVWGWLDWSASCSFDTGGNFNNNFTSTFYGSTPDHPHDSNANPPDNPYGFTGGLNMSTCEVWVLGVDTGKTAPCPPATLKESKDITVGSDGSTTFSNDNKIGGKQGFDFKL